MKDVLIIEDDMDILGLLADFFEGYQIALASSHCSATRLLSSHPFKLVISDYHLIREKCCGLKTGLDVFRYMEDNRIETPFIIFSSEQIDASKFNAKNFLGIISKPNHHILIQNSIEVLEANVA